ncbi:MAG: hypothetical protein A2Y81_10710 [Nitrospirae bacterium RBG_13_43_8]|nr:MAG: hypothetical protein A2Y81_10710 [Nitrospirae bacterium RBG_13_43_8]
MGKKPALFLMCHTTAGYAETVAKIDEIPDDLIAEAIEEKTNKKNTSGCILSIRELETGLEKN